ncbi:MAG: glycoside hydrolase family 10 protein, partial [Saprospiraceae bacterium]
EVVMEIVMEYDVDAIHFDDYFYPYPANGEPFPDAEDFTKYGYGFYSIDDWRRNNVDKLISQVSQVIKTVAPDVKFGVSPFGVWRNSSADPANGSLTRANVSAYDNLYADVRGWLEKGWIDYVAPQIYWNIGYRVADYETLLNWWQRNTFGRALYAGQAVYKVSNNPESAWKTPGEISRQVRLNRSLPAVAGSVFYNASSLLGNPFGVLDSLRNVYFSEPALIPEMPWLNLPEPAPPGLGKIKLKNGEVTFDCSVNRTRNNATYLVVYRFEDRLPGDYNNPENILTTIHIGNTRKVTVVDDSAVTGKVYTYAVSAVNRQHTESALSKWHAVQVDTKKLKRLK